MASVIQDIANGVGFLYITKADGTTIITSKPNSVTELGNIKLDGLMTSPISGDTTPFGKITVTSAVNPGGNLITSVTVDGVVQTGAAGVVIVAGDENATAENLKNDINTTVAASGHDYTATRQGAVVTLHAYGVVDPEAINDDVVAIVATGASTFTTEDISGGFDGNGVFDPTRGHRYFINASAAAVEGSLAGTTEITEFIVSRGLQVSILAVINKQIADGVLTTTRQSSITEVYIQTEGAAATDTLDQITEEGFVEGDIMIIKPYDGTKVTTFKDISVATNGNMFLQGQEDFLTLDPVLLNNNTITMQFRADSFGSVVGWHEQSRSLLNIPNDAVTTLKILDTAVTTSKVADDAITNDKLDSTPASEAVDTNVIKDDAVTTVKIIDDAITADKLDTESTREPLPIRLSFETGEQGEYEIKVPFACSVIEIESMVVFALAGSDDGTIQFKNNAGTNFTDGLVTHLASAVFGNTVNVVPTGNNTFVAGETIKALTAKTTAGGKVQISVIVERV